MVTVVMVGVGLLAAIGPVRRDLDSRALFHYPFTAITLAMALEMVGVGSQYAIATVDADGNYLDGSKTYSVTMPAGIPAQDVPRRGRHGVSLRST